MVTAAVWADIDHDGRPDLILATEWGPVVYFHNNGHGLENWTARAGLAERTGWWSSLAVADLGRRAPRHHRRQRRPEHQVPRQRRRAHCLYAGDLDGSGRQQLVEAQYEGGKLYPVRGRSKLAYVYPWITKKFPTYESYAHATVDQIFPAEHLAKAKRYAATELASGVYVQKADGTFEFKPLPSMAQISPINGIVVRDLEGTGKPDVYCVGNNYGPEPSTGRFDGGVSVLLRGDGHGGLTAVPAWQSGLLAPGTRATWRS
jgi:hypothetical protein